MAERFGDFHSAIAEHLRTGRNIDEVRFLLRRYSQSFVVGDDEGGAPSSPTCVPTSSSAKRFAD